MYFFINQTQPTTNRSTKFQEFQEVLQEVKSKNDRRVARSSGGGGSCSGGGGSGGGRGRGGAGASRAVDPHDETPGSPQQHYSTRQPRTENGTFAPRAKHGVVGRAAPPQGSPEAREPVLKRERLMQEPVMAVAVAPKRPGPGRPPNKSYAAGVGRGRGRGRGRGGGGRGGGVAVGGGDSPEDVVEGGEGGGGRGDRPVGMGEVAAAAQAARRGRCIDTVVLAKCRRKSQTMWPARLCSKREVREAEKGIVIGVLGRGCGRGE